MNVQKEALLPFSAKQMFDLVNDVRAYASFLPWCDQSDILEESSTEMIARLAISAAGLRKTFSTRNTLIPGREIRMQHLDGPFQHLEGVWTFEDLGPEGCLVHLNLHFELKPGLQAMILGTVFKKASSKLMEAFCLRAQEIYDQP